MFFSLTLLVTASILFTVDSALGRVDLHSISDQDCMELVVGDLVTRMALFRDINGDFCDACEWFGVLCDSEETVIEINWEAMPCNGSIRLDILPQKLRRLHLRRKLYGNLNGRFTGTLDSSSLPRLLECVSLRNNSFYGMLDCTSFPTDLQIFNIEENQFEGDLNLSQLPENLEILNLSWNKFHGSIDLSTLPKQLWALYLQKNSLSGWVDLSSLPHCLEFVDMSGNSLYGSNLSTTTLSGPPKSPWFRCEYFKKIAP